MRAGAACARSTLMLATVAEEESVPRKRRGAQQGAAKKTRWIEEDFRLRFEWFTALPSIGPA
jgi:hypothetical protein